MSINNASDANIIVYLNKVKVRKIIKNNHNNNFFLIPRKISHILEY